MTLVSEPKPDPSERTESWRISCRSSLISASSLNYLKRFSVSMENPQMIWFGLLCSPNHLRISLVRFRGMAISPSAFDLAPWLSERGSVIGYSGGFYYDVLILCPL